MYNKEKKKSNKAVIVILILIIIGLVIALLFATGIISFNKKIDQQDEKKVETEEVKDKGEELDINSDIVKSLMYIPEQLTFYPDDLFGYFYKQDSYTIDNISNQMKLSYGMLNLLISENNENNFEEEYDNKTISSYRLEEFIKNSFGSNVEFDNEDLKSSCKVGIWTYDSNEKVYHYYANGCGGTLLPSYKRKIVSAIKYNDRIEIMEKVAYSEYETNEEGVFEIIYKSDKKDNVIETIKAEEEFNIDKYLNKLDSYKYTFKKEGDNYYFYSVELVK